MSIDNGFSIMDVYPWIRALCSKACSGDEDLVNDVVVYVLLRVHKYDPEKGTAMAFVKNLFYHCLSEQRRKKKIIARGFGSDIVDYRGIDNSNTWEAVTASIEHLDEPFRTVMLYRVDGLSYTAIASRLQIDVRAVKRYAKRGISDLARLYAK